MERATTFIKKVKPDPQYLPHEDHEETTGETTGATTASSSKKNGVRTATISSDYGMEITLKHVKRA